MLEIPQFGRTTKIKICIKLLLICIHGWFLWLDRAVSIDTQFIAWIIGMPSVGEYPLPLFTDKTWEKSLAERMKGKYGTFRGARKLDVTSINDNTVIFETWVLAYNILRKCCKDQVPTGVIAIAEKCTTRVMMNYSTFLVNQFLMDCREAQEKGQSSITPSY
jgi:hypothetical protein